MLGQIKVLALQSPQIIISEFAVDFERQTGYRIVQLLQPTDLPIQVKRRTNGGEIFDAAFLETGFLNQLIDEGKIIGSSRTNFLRVPLGVAVRSGAPKPDISSVESVKRTLLDARSLAYLKAGISGPYLQGLFERLGIAAELQTKSRRPDTDTVGDLVAAGQAEIGVTAIATLIATRGVDIVGPLPREIQSYVFFAAAVSANAVHPEIAGELIKVVTGPAAIPTIRSKGMEPW
jgi:molybdate transport system substrate-binding protein